MPGTQSLWEEKLNRASLSQKNKEYVRKFCVSVAKHAQEDCTKLLLNYISFVEEECRNPKKFPSYHEREREPIDYYQFGLDAIRRFIDYRHSHIIGLDQLHAIDQI